MAVRKKGWVWAECEISDGNWSLAKRQALDVEQNWWAVIWALIDWQMMGTVLYLSYCKWKGTQKGRSWSLTEWQAGCWAEVMNGMDNECWLMSAQIELSVPDSNREVMTFDDNGCCSIFITEIQIMHVQKWRARAHRVGARGRSKCAGPWARQWWWS